MPDDSSLERSVPSFQGGKRSGRLTRQEFGELATQFFDTLLYKYLDQRSEGTSIDVEYPDNESFWLALLQGRHFQGQRIALRGFHITEWLPYSPGLYFSSTAKAQRQRALEAIDQGSYGVEIYGDAYNNTDGILLPGGKEQMMLGGIGSVRLRSTLLDNQVFYYLGASSTGVSHEGVPVSMREHHYRTVIPLIKSSCGARADIIGSLQVLPQDKSLLHFNAATPRYCLLVEDIRVFGPSTPSDLLVTVAVMYAPDVWKRFTHSADRAAAHLREPKSWTFCSFTPDVGEAALRRSVEWLRGYAIRFSEDPNPVMFCDFDEHYQHYPNPVEFSLRSLLEGGIDVAALKQYAEIYGLNVNIGMLRVGDVFSNVQNSTIINRSHLRLNWKSTRLTRVEQARKVPDLRRLLHDASAGVRTSGIEVLGKLGAAAKPAIPEIVSALQDSNPTVRLRAASALGEIGQKTKLVSSGLANACRDTEVSVRAAAVQALGKLGVGSYAVIQVLSQALDDSATISTRYGRNCHEDTEHRISVGAIAANALGYLGPQAHPAVPKLAAALRDENIGPSAARALRGIGNAAKEAVPDLIQAVKSGQVELVREAIEALSLISAGSGELVDVFVEGLQHGDDIVRMDSARALASSLVPTQQTLHALAAALQDKAHCVRDRTLTTLRAIDHEGTFTIEALHRALLENRSEYASTSVESIEALKSFGSKANIAESALVKVLTEGFWSVRCAAAQALGAVQPNPDIAAPALVKALTDENSAVRAAAATSLSQIAAPFPLGQIAVRWPEMQTALTDLLSDEAFNVREAAKRALKGIGVEEK